MKKISLIFSVLLLSFALFACGGGDLCEHDDKNGDGICDKCTEILDEVDGGEGNGPGSEGNGPGEEHTHAYTEENTAPKYLSSAASCTGAAKYFKSCTCGERGTETFTSGSPLPHSHTEEKTEDKFISAPATCESAAKYFKSCACGDIGSETFKSGNPSLHNTVDGECTTCHTRESTAGLSYSLNDDGVSYTVTGMGNCTSQFVTIGIHDNKSVTAIGKNAFSYEDTLRSISIGKFVNFIGDGAFNGCGGMNSVYITDLAKWCEITFEGIHSNPFSKAHKLYLNSTEQKELVIPEGVERISDRAFSGGRFTSITFSDSVKSIGSWAFHDNGFVTKINWGNGLAEIGDYAFYLCSSLESLDISEGVTRIGDYAFANCSRIKTVSIPNSLDVLGDGNFSGYLSLQYNVYDNALYVGNETNPYLVLVKLSSSNVTACTTHADTKFIAQNAFAYSSIKTVTIGEGVRSIGKRAFSQCTSLESVNFESKEGWSYVKDNEDGTKENVTIPASELQNTATAATYLLTTYGDFDWNRK